MNFTYDPNEFAIDMEMYMNDDVIFSNSFSGEYRPLIKTIFTSLL